MYSVYHGIIMAWLRRHKWLILLALIVATIGIWHMSYSSAGKNLEVAFLDIGQGDSIYIEAPNGRQILIDGGRNSQVLSQLSKVMQFHDRSIDVVIATHPDADHIGGLPYVMDNYKVGLALEPGVSSDTETYKSFLSGIEKYNIPHEYARRGMSIILDSKNNVHLDILFPDQDVTGWETNKASIVARLVYGNESFLLTGDSPREIEHYLFKLDALGLKSNVLKLGHHGSHTSSSSEFVQAVAPEYAIISAGLNNSYGHPHKETLQTLAKFNIETFRTDQLGTIIFESDGVTLWKK